MKTGTERRPSRLRRGSVLAALAATAALVMGAIVPTVAYAAPPAAGTYEGTSNAWNGAEFGFDIAEDGTIKNLTGGSYCQNGSTGFPEAFYWSGDAPAVPIEAGEPFDFEWQGSGDSVRPYYELSGTVNADGTASGTGRAGFLPSGTCGGYNFTWTVERVGGTDPDPVEVTAAAPTRDGNTVTIPTVEGVTYVDGAGAELSGTVTVAEGQTLTVTATADEGYVLADGTHEWVFEYEDQTPDLVEVTAAAPTRDGNVVTIPVVEGVTYVDGAGAVLSGSVTLTEGQTLTVAATADEGYVLADGTHEWTFVYEGEDPDPVEVTAAAPTRDGNTVTIPTVEGVSYTDDSGAVLTGAVELSEGQVLTVSAAAEDGYVLADGTHEWVFEYEDQTPDPVEVTATAPTRDGNTVTIPTVEGVTYVDGANAVLSGSVTLNEGETLTVTATADEGYVLADGTHEWSFEYEDVTDPDPETIPSTPPSEEDLDPALEGAIDAPDTAKAGETISVSIDDAAEGDEIGVWLFSDPVYLGTQTVDGAGNVTVTIPADTAEGNHKIAAWAAGSEAQIGWDALAVTVGDGDDGDQEGDANGGSNGGSKDGLASTGAAGGGIAASVLAALLLLGAGATLMRRRNAIR